MAAACAMMMPAYAAGGSMAAPAVSANAIGMGFVTIYDLPTTSTSVSTVLSEDDEGSVIAKIYSNGALLQRFDELTVSGERAVHYLDANFDGYVDILIGTGASRNYSVLLVWNQSLHRFEKVDNSMNGDILLQPSTCTLILQCSGSWCSNYYTRYRLTGAVMTEVDQLLMISERSEYITYEVTNKYTVRRGRRYDSMGELLNPGVVDCSVAVPSGLPKAWQLILSAYDKFYDLER